MDADSDVESGPCSAGPDLCFEPNVIRRYLVVAENLMLLEYIKLLRPRFNAYWCGPRLLMQLVILLSADRVPFCLVCSPHSALDVATVAAEAA